MGRCVREREPAVSALLRAATHELSFILSRGLPYHDGRALCVCARMVYIYEAHALSLSLYEQTLYNTRGTTARRQHKQAALPPLPPTAPHTSLSLRTLRTLAIMALIWLAGVLERDERMGE